LAKLYKQTHRLDVEDDFFIIAENMKRAKDVFFDSSKEIVDYLLEDTVPIPVIDVKEITDLTPEEEGLLAGVIWDKKGLNKELEKPILKNLKKRMEEVI